MRASGEKFNEYLDKVREHFPKGFEVSIQIEGLSMCVTSYCAIAFMRDGDPKICANTIVAKLGVEDE